MRLSDRQRIGVVAVTLACVLVIALLAGRTTQFPNFGDGVILRIPTYDGSGQVAHPTVIDFLTENGLESWGGYRYWMSGSPYPNASDVFENPCLWVSHDGITWEIPRGMVEPLIPAPADYRHHSIYNSDPTIVYNAGNDAIELYYRESRGRGDDDAIVIHRLDITMRADRSAFAVEDSAVEKCDANYPCKVTPVPLTLPAFSRTKTLLSPSVVIDGEGNHLMYAVGTAPTGALSVLMLKSDRSGTTYSEPVVCAPAGTARIKAPEGMTPVTPWHLTAKGDISSGDITLLINGQSRQGKTRVRNLYWAHTRFETPTQMVYPQTEPFLQAQDGWQPYRSAFVLPSEEQDTSLRLWLNIYSEKRPQTWGIVFREQ